VYKYDDKIMCGYHYTEVAVCINVVWVMLCGYTDSRAQRRKIITIWLKAYNYKILWKSSHGEEEICDTSNNKYKLKA
jgi:hypothetical protein